MGSEKLLSILLRVANVAREDGLLDGLDVGIRPQGIDGVFAFHQRVGPFRHSAPSPLGHTVAVGFRLPLGRSSMMGFGVLLCQYIHQFER